MARSWFQFQNAAVDNVASVSIFDEIGYYGVTAKDFIAELSNLTAATINLDINSPGGSVFDGIAIYNALANRAKAGTVINVTVLGVAASVASVIAMAGTTIKMPANTFMMIHNPWGNVSGGSSDMREYADLLDKIANSLVATYVVRTGKPEADIRALLQTDTWLTADEALALGFCDEVVAAYDVSAKFNMDVLPENVKSAFIKNQAGRTVTQVPATTCQPELTFFDKLSALATQAGMQEYAGMWAMSAGVTLDSVSKAITEAREITALCALVKQPLMAGQLIRSGSSIGNARFALTEFLAADDEQKVTDTTQRNGIATVQNVGPVPITTAGIWASRQKQSIRSFT